jgi:hypothetical protein
VVRPARYPRVRGPPACGPDHPLVSTPLPRPTSPFPAYLHRPKSHSDKATAHHSDPGSLAVLLFALPAADRRRVQIWSLEPAFDEVARPIMAAISGARGAWDALHAGEREGESESESESEGEVVRTGEGEGTRGRDGVGLVWFEGVHTRPTNGVSYR